MLKMRKMRLYNCKFIQLTGNVFIKTLFGIFIFLHFRDNKTGQVKQVFHGDEKSKYFWRKKATAVNPIVVFQAVW